MSYTWRGKEIVLQWKCSTSSLKSMDFSALRSVFDPQANLLQYFQSCLMGATFYNCCDYFKPAYVTMRGKCFRLTNYSQGLNIFRTSKEQNFQLEQRSTPNWSLSSVNLTAFSLLGQNRFELFQSFPQNPLQPQMVVYVGDDQPEVNLFPRFYLNRNEYGRLRLTQQRLHILEQPHVCSVKDASEGWWRANHLRIRFRHGKMLCGEMASSDGPSTFQLHFGLFGSYEVDLFGVHKILFSAFHLVIRFVQRNLSLTITPRSCKTTHHPIRWGLL